MHDVVVVGAGNAGLCAAMAAAEAGARVLVLEKAPKEMRGGNTYFTGAAYRFPYDAIEDIQRLIPDLSPAERDAIDVGAYPKSQFRDDLLRVSGGNAHPAMVDTLVDRSFPSMLWLREHGLRWVLMYGRQSFSVDGKRRFWGGLIVEAVGGGSGLSDDLFAGAEACGAEIRYESAAADLVLDESGGVSGIRVESGGSIETISASAVVLACGGFESSEEMRVQHLGPEWAKAKVRGTEFNTGAGIQMALAAGAARDGDWAGCHAVAWDLNAPPFGNRRIADLYQKHSYPLGITVNINGERFIDEGADFRNYTYAKYGREILKQPHGVAFQIFDAKVEDLLRDEYRIPQVTKVSASSVAELADQLGVDSGRLVDTVDHFNSSIGGARFDPSTLDGKRTEGNSPPKSNWAQPIDTPPYVGYSVTCGITFTYGGLRIDADARVLSDDSGAIDGLYAAGELVGGLYHGNYVGGTGLMAGTVFGRIAGTGAALYASRL
jgi:tricarballylate dehydrogenase